MYMITGANFKPHVYSIRMFKDIHDIQAYLRGLHSLDSHSMVPNVFEIWPGEKPKLLEREWHQEYIWPHTAYNKECKARKEDLTRI